MNTNWTPHIKETQPEETHGKQVIYRCHGSDIIHAPYPANDLNWLTVGDRRPAIGMISEYKIVQ